MSPLVNLNIEKTYKKHIVLINNMFYCRNNCILEL